MECGRVSRHGADQTSPGSIADTVTRIHIMVAVGFVYGSKGFKEDFSIDSINMIHNRMKIKIFY